MATPHRLASGPGWSVDDVLCTAGPHDRPYEERHEQICIAVVIDGTFQYRASQGDALLVPGAVLLGNAGQCFECGHEHGRGDHCIAFRFTPDYVEAVCSAVPQAKTALFEKPRLPPLASLIPLIAAAEAARTDSLRGEFEELALRLAGAVVTLLAGEERCPDRLDSRRDRRIAEALRRIASEAYDVGDEPLSVSALAAEAAMSPYHFLRAFQQAVGMTPHQFILHRRLQRAAVELRHSRESVSTIAYNAGFADLSTFNRRFRRIMGMSPSAYRLRRRTHVQNV